MGAKKKRIWQSCAIYLFSEVSDNIFFDEKCPEPKQNIWIDFLTVAFAESDAMHSLTTAIPLIDD